MKLFVHSNAHAAGAYAVNDCKVAQDDRLYTTLGILPHPDNYNICWGLKLSEFLKAKYETVPASDNNTNIIATTKEWLSNQTEDVVIIIGWNDTENTNEIFNFHLWLKEQGIVHVFFDTVTKLKFKYNFGPNYLEYSYTSYLKETGHEPVITSDEYFGKGGHSEWTIYLLKHLVKYNMI